MMHKFARTCLAGALLACLATLPAQVAAQEGETPAPVRPAKVFVVEKHSAKLSRRYPAIVHPSQEAELSFRVSGQVVSLPVRAASRLKQGDIVAELDKRDFETAIARLESQRDQARAQLDALIKGARDEEIIALKAAVFAAQAKVDQAREQAERTKNLYEKEIVAKAQLEKDEAALRVALADLRTAQEQLAIGESGGREEEVAAAEAALRGLETEVKKARDDLKDATLRAPFDGVVARRFIDNYTNIKAGETIVLLQKITTVDLVFDIPSTDVLMWTALDWDTLGTKVKLTGSNIELTDSELIEFSTQADLGTQTYQTRLAVKVPEGIVALAGMVGEVEIYAPGLNEARLSVPLTALATSPEGTSFVWIVDPASGAVSAREVSTGDTIGDEVIVTAGLAGGETIVSAGVSRLSEGLVVRPVTQVGN